jgi:chorismate-pyruvate lyase
MEDGIDVVEVELAEGAHPLGRIVVQDHRAARRSQRIDVRAAREETESAGGELALEHARQLARARAATAELNERLCATEVIHIRILSSPQTP